VKTFSRVVADLSRVMYLIAGLTMVCSVLLTVSDVVLRTFKMPILGTYELVGVFAAIMVGFALPETSRARGHVFMDLAASHFPSKVAKVFHVISRILGIAFFASVSWYLWIMGNDYLATGETSTTLLIPLYPVAYALAICCIVECLVLFVEMFEQKEVEP